MRNLLNGSFYLRFCGMKPPKLEHLQHEQTELHLCPNCASRLKNNPELIKRIAETKTHR